MCLELPSRTGGDAIRHCASGEEIDVDRSTEELVASIIRYDSVAPTLRN